MSALSARIFGPRHPVAIPEANCDARAHAPICIPDAVSTGDFQITAIDSLSSPDVQYLPSTFLRGQVRLRLCALCRLGAGISTSADKGEKPVQDEPTPASSASR
jgi:hypothetical protein